MQDALQQYFLRGAAKESNLQRCVWRLRFNFYLCNIIFLCYLGIKLKSENDLWEYIFFIIWPNETSKSNSAFKMLKLLDFFKENCQHFLAQSAKVLQWFKNFIKSVRIPGKSNKYRFLVLGVCRPKLKISARFGW